MSLFTISSMFKLVFQCKTTSIRVCMKYHIDSYIDNICLNYCKVIFLTVCVCQTNNICLNCCTYPKAFPTAIP